MDTFFQQKFSPEDIRAIFAKKRPYGGAPYGTLANVGYAVVIFVSLAVLMPVYVTVILPVVGIYAGLVLYPRRKELAKIAKVEAATPLEAPSTTSKPPPLDDREFDVVIYGVTGLCGNIVAEYLMAVYGSKIRLAFAGRSEAKLQARRAELVTRTGFTGHIPLVIADSSDQESLMALCRRTKVVATTVGPYKKYGEPLVRACAYSGTGYCDLTGETDWATDMYKKYDGVAKATGARILHFCGVDSIPSEIGTQMVVDRFKTKFGSTPKYVDNVVWTLGGGLPGGTVDTVITVIENGGPSSAPRAPASAPRTPPKARTTVSATTPQYLKSVQSWIMPWVMGSVNSATVKHSNALVGFAPDLNYTEGQAVPSPLYIAATVIPFMVGLTLFVLPPVRELLFSIGVLPRPGDGPSRRTMERGSTDFRLSAYDDKGNRAELRFAGLGDPGCLQTAIFMSETAVLLAQQHQGMPVGAGLTPGSAIGHKLLVPKLQQSGWMLIE